MPAPVQQRVKHPAKIMVWGIMSAKEAGRLHVCESNMNKDQYLNVLRTRVIPQIQDWYPNDNAIFMHDSAPCHKAKICTAFLETSGITVLDWPGNSPDLNPIETLWGVVKQRISKIDIPSRNDLISNLIRIWHRDASIVTTCQKLVESMPRRIQAVY